MGGVKHRIVAVVGNEKMGEVSTEKYRTGYNGDGHAEEKYR